MENIQDVTKASEVTQSFGVDRWQRKKSRYEMEEFIVSPPSQEEGGFFQLRYGKTSGHKASTYNKITQELSQDTQGTLAGSVMSYLGVENQRPNVGKIGGSISMDASGGLTFDDFTKHPDPPSDISYPDLMLETQMFPQADPLITLPWGKHSLSRETTSTPENHSITLAPEYDSEEKKITQAVKNLNIAAKEVTYADMTTQGCDSIILDTPKTSKDNHQPVKEESHTRVRKRSGLQEYVSSISMQTNKSHSHLEEEHDEEDEKEENNRIVRENERQSEIFNQNMGLTQQKNKPPLNNQYNTPNNFNERAAEDENNDLVYEPYKPLAQLEPVAINDKENIEKLNTSTNDKITDTSEVKCEMKVQESVKLPKEDLRERKTSLLALVTPFIPFKESRAESESPVTPKEELNEHKQSKAVSRFFYTEEYEERKRSNSKEPEDLSHNSEQLKFAESSISNNIASSSKPKVKKRRPKPSALREMNVWGPSSM